MQKEQRLGKKVFYYYLSRKITTGLGLLIISIICVYLKEPIFAKILFFLPKQTAIGITSLIFSLLFLISLILLVGGFLMSWASYVSCTFTLEENALTIKRGILSKKQISIPYSKIQNVNIERTFSQRVMGICKLIIQTAGNDENDKEGEAEGVLDLIDFDLAENIQKTLLEKSNPNGTEKQIPFNI